jgi:hypothetical protein
MDSITVFIGGIIQGSRNDTSIHPQDYRERLRTVLEERCPGWTIVDPVEIHPDSISYDSTTSIETFTELVETAARSDLLIAYLPEASMGTAIEMWECKRAGVPIICITQMTANWTVQATATAVLSSLEEFDKFVENGSIQELIAARQRPNAES